MGPIQGRGAMRVSALALCAVAGLAVALGWAGPSGEARASQQRALAPSVSLTWSGAGFRSAGVVAAFSGFSTTFNVEIEYGPTTAYGSSCCSNGGYPADTATTALQTPLILDDGTTYHMRLRVDAGTTTYYSNDVAVTTKPSGPPLIDFYNPPSPTLFGSTCFSDTLEINTKGYDTTWYAAAGTDLANPVLSDPIVMPAVDADEYLLGANSQLGICLPPQSPGTVLYLQLHASNAKGSTTGSVVTYTVPPPPTFPTTTSRTPPPLPPLPPTGTGGGSGGGGGSGAPGAPGAANPVWLQSPDPLRVGLPANAPLVYGGRQPYAITVVSGALPPGLTVTPNGYLNGTPTAAGRFVFTLHVAGSDAVANPVDWTFTVVVNRARATVVLPQHALTPGATDPAVRQATIRKTICVSGWVAKVEPPVSFTDALKVKQMKEYGETGSPRGYEEDHLIPLELGGAPRSAKNLWPEPHAQSKHSDPLETGLKRKVCAGTLTLAAARKQILTYKRTHG